MLLGINNFYELIDADTQGSIPALIQLAGEAGVSAVLVSEESWKSRWATLEARISSYISSASLATGAPPKDWGLELLPWKGKSGGGCMGETPCRSLWRSLMLQGLMPQSFAELYRDLARRAR